MVALLILPSLLLAQNKPGTPLLIKKAKGAIKLDGVLDEPDWVKADVAKDWYLNYPTDCALAPKQTEARVTSMNIIFMSPSSVTMTYRKT